ncbi:MAG TPA: hypothetical protein VFQ45_23485 [Longimicrobium sp.]|nr:hypothetical protein [Longimicrobium sp.]
MSRPRILAGAALCAALCTAFAGALPAQSSLSARGLGYPLEPLTARARALGGAEAALPEPALSLVNPAAVVGLPAGGFSVTFQSDGFTPEGDDADETTTTRFPAVQVAFPFGERAVLTVGYAAFLDQNWRVEREDTLDLSSGRTPVVDRFAASGGVARFRAGGGYRVLGRLDVGATIDVYTGALRDTLVRFIRDFETTRLGADYRWQGVGLTGGARWRGEAFSVGASLSAGGTLEVEPRDSAAGGKSYTLPVTFNAGASARVAQQLLVAASLRWQGWSAADGELAESGGARDALSAGGGIEFEGFSLLGRRAPLRLGARMTQLPFRDDAAGTEFADERALTGGLGLQFAGGQANLDLAGEIGRRGGDTAGLDESFWRVSLSLSLLSR